MQGRNCPLPPPPQALTVLKLGKRLSGDAPLRRKVRKCLMSSGECSGRPGIGSDARRGLLCPEGPGGRGRAASARGGTACVETGHGEHLSAAIGRGVTAHAVHRCGIRGAPALPLRCYIGWNPPPRPPVQHSRPQAQLCRLPRIFPRTIVSSGCQVKIERVLIIFCFKENTTGTGGTWGDSSAQTAAFCAATPSPDPFLPPPWAGMGLRSGGESIHQQKNKTK